MSRAGYLRQRRNRSKASRALWFQVYRARIRDGLEHCRECGLVSAELTLGHLVPVVEGGPTKFDNITILCGPDNVRQGNQRWPHQRSLMEEEADAPPERQWVRLASVAAAELNHAKFAMSPQRRALLPLVEAALRATTPRPVTVEQVGQAVGCEDARELLAVLRALQRRGVTEAAGGVWWIVPGA